MIDPPACLDSPQSVALVCSAETGHTHVRLLEMIVRAEPLESVMTAIIRAMAADPVIAGGAILVLRNGSLESIACSGIPGAVLDHLRSVPVCDLLDDESLGAHCVACEVAIRPLFSGAGEILGALAAPPAPMRRTSKSSKASPASPLSAIISLLN